jgi:magnesium transporter
MEPDTQREAWENLRELAAANNQQNLQDFIDSLSSSEAMHAIFRLNAEDRELVLTSLEPEEAAELIDEIPDEHAADIIEQLPAESAAAILNEMDSDDQADVLGEMTEQDAEAILNEMAPEEAKDARRLMKYEDDEAGGLMMTEVFAFEEDVTVGEVLQNLTDAGESGENENVSEIYVISRWKRLIGVVRLNEIVLSGRNTAIADLVTPSSFVTPETKLDELERMFNRNEMSTFPVINPHARVIGIVTRDAVAEALNERAEEEYRKLQGIVGGDEIRTLPLVTRSRRRLSWLSINIVLNIIAASVIAFYEDTLSAVIALAVFLPIISDMSGCSGNQAVAVSMRELSLGLVKPYEAFRVWLKEISVGLINGITLGCLLGIAAWFWKENFYLSLVVASALALNSLIAVSIGGCVPLLLKRCGVDPAVASGPILTTVTDMCGFFLVLSIATMMLPQLVAG